MTAMDAYKRITQANIGSTPATWRFNSSTNLISQISATGVQGNYPNFNFMTRNLTSRQNTIHSLSETFGYDQENLDQLISVTGPVGLAMTYTTDKSGNILTKSDAGTYVYNASRPYAVEQITNGQNISTSPQTIRYTAFGKVKQISEDTRTAEFDYNADQQRVRMVMRNYGSVYKTRYYFGGSCEREVVGSTTTQYIWIGGDAYTAVAVAKKVGTGAWTVYNIFRDHLGTIEYLKNGSNPADEYSFDAWGRRRDKDNWSYTLTSEPALFADRGFTGHEYLEDFKLYNMNGRLYDPVVGRFLSPDPFIQDPANTQSYNRYSYCLNNPLTLNDPSGYKWNWNWLNPMYWFVEGMQAINDNTKGVRREMQKMHIPDFNAGGSKNSNGNVYFKGDIWGHEVFNTENYTQYKGEQDAVQNANSSLDRVRTESKQAAKLVAMGWGVEANAFIFGINLGWFTSGATGGLVVTFTSGPSNNLSMNVYGATVTSSKNGFKVNDLRGKGVEWTIGKGIVGFTRGSNNFENPDYYINQLSFGIGCYDKSGGVLNTGTFVVPTLPVLGIEPHY